jgi:hypothetical protein
MSEQRIQTVKIDWQTGDAKTKVVEFTRSIKGTDKAVEELNKTLGDSATVTNKTTLSKKEMTAQARKEFTAATRLVTKYNNLTDSLKQQSKMYNMTDDAAEIYAAQMRLGANATKEQKDEVARLITVMQKQRAVSGKVQGSMRGLRGQAQNLGWQMQDVAVQMQAGTDAMVIFSQQGSQLASGFGPSGALVGALIAVGGAIAGVVLKTAEMKEIQKLTAVSTKELTARLYELAKAGKELNYHEEEATKDLQKRKIKNTIKALEDQRKQTAELRKESERLSEVLRQKEKFASTQTELDRQMDIQKQKDATEALVSSTAKQLTLEKDLAKAKRNLQNIIDGKPFEKDTKEKKENIEVMDAHIQAHYKYLEALKKEDDAAKATVAGWENKTFLMGESARSQALATAMIKATTSAEVEHLPTLQLAINKYYDKKDAIDALNKSQKEQLSFEKQLLAQMVEEADEAERVRKLASDELAQSQAIIESWKTKIKLLGLSAREQALLNAQLSVTTSAQVAHLPVQEKLINKYYDEKDALEAVAQAEKDRVRLSKEAYKQAEAEVARREKVLGGASREIGAGKTGDPVLDEMVKHNRLMETLNEERKKIGWSRYEEHKRINELTEAEQSRHKQVMGDLAHAGLQAEYQAGAEFLSGMTNVMAQLTAIAQDGSKEAEAMFYATQAVALASTIVNTEMAASKAMAFSSTGTLAEMISSALAVRSLGYASAGIIAGTTFAGMFDKGGVIPNGQAGVVAERYDEMVGGTMVYNNSGSGLNVTGSKDTAAMVGGGGLNVTVVNNATGSVKTEVQQIDENNVKILIAEHFSKNIDKSVSGVIGKKGSKTDKAMRQNFNTTRKY